MKWDDIEETDFEEGESGEGEFSDPYDEDKETAENEEASCRPCPECRAEVYEGAEQCPRCGSYIVLRSRRPGWFFAAAILCIVIVLVIWLGLPGSIWQALRGL